MLNYQALAKKAGHASPFIWYLTFLAIGQGMVRIRYSAESTATTRPIYSKQLKQTAASSMRLEFSTYFGFLQLH